MYKSQILPWMSASSLKDKELRRDVFLESNRLSFTLKCLQKEVLAGLACACLTHVHMAICLHVPFPHQAKEVP